MQVHADFCCCYPLDATNTITELKGDSDVQGLQGFDPVADHGAVQGGLHQGFLLEPEG